jgi:hypothetical protein
VEDTAKAWSDRFDALQAEFSELKAKLADGSLRGADGANGKDGKNGLDGKDGFGFDDVNVEFDGERTITLVFERGEERKEFPVTLSKLPNYQGVLVPSAGRTYQVGDLVTFGGHVWRCDVATDQEPRNYGPKLWTKAVHRGRDGKDAR